MAFTSVADLRGVFSVDTPTPSPTKKQPAPPQVRKPEGIPRELFALIGDSAPSLTAQLAKPRLKQKPNLGGGSKVKWELRTFTNGMRKDRLQLKHWVKAGDDPNQPYPFEKYNTAHNAFSYTSEEYNRMLEDQDWPRDETDYLFALVQEYDSRWYIICDRYDFPGGVTRTMEDLKDRYYSACRKLVRARELDDAVKQSIVSSLGFDKDRELMRKKYITSLENRSPEQVAEEEALYIELKRLEQNERKFRKDREELLRTIAGIECGLPDVIEDDSPMATLASDMKKKKKGMDFEPPPTPSSASATTKRIPPKNPAYDAQHHIIRADTPTASSLTTKNAHTPAYLRSYRLPTPKSTVSAKVNQALLELNINHTRLVMPTKDTCAALENLLDAAATLVDLKRLVDKIDFEKNVLLGRNQTPGAPNPSESVPPATPSTPVQPTEGDGADAEGSLDGDNVGEDGRAQSVVSTRSTRSRKKTRSGSISSVDTAATGRATKRQKRI